jgi:hypothetical protein
VAGRFPSSEVGRCGRVEVAVAGRARGCRAWFSDAGVLFEKYPRIPAVPGTPPVNSHRVSTSMSPHW